MRKTKSKSETSHLELQPDSIVCIKATHPLWAGECCTVVGRPSPDAAIVELQSGGREYLALKYLQPACSHEFHPTWQNNGTLVERCDCGETKPPLPSTLATVWQQMTEARNGHLLRSHSNVEHQIQWLSEQLEQMNGQVQGSICESSEVESNLQESVVDCKKLAPSKSEVEVLPAVMTEVEARQCIEAIKNHAISLRRLLVELEDRRGWEVLGYTSITACMVAEFDNSKPVLIRELKVGRIEEHYLQVPIGTYRESQLRPLSQLDPGEYRLAVEKAHELAGTARLTAGHVTKAVNELLGSARFAKTTAAQQYKPGELVRIACQPGALLEQKAWDGCWGTVPQQPAISALLMS